MAAEDPNPLISTSKPSDSPLTVKLHPLVLLTITDFISRHTLTQREGPIAGAVIGQQDGRAITMEHAFETSLKPKSNDDGRERIIIDEPWFGERLTQYKEVHATPPLDLVAAFTLGSTSGPAPEHVPLVQQLKANYNDDVILILFHPESVLDGSLTGGKLPITIYESFYEPGSEGADKGLQVDGWGIGRQLQLKFRQLPFEVETGEAEMIAVDYVAKGAANANVAVEGTRKPGSAASSKGKEKSAVSVPADEAPAHVLSAEDDEVIASLTSKSNAIKMLQTRLNLIRSYLTTLPPSYLTDASVQPSQETEVNHVLLRQISSLLSRLPLLAPPSSSPSAAAASTSESDSVALITLLSSLTRTIASAGDLTQKANVVNRARHDKRMAGLARGDVTGGGSGGGGSGDQTVFGTPGGARFGRGGGGRGGGLGMMSASGGNIGGAGGGGGSAAGQENFEGGFDSGADGVEEEY